MRRGAFFLAHNGNIVDFNEARAASSVRRARDYADNLASTMAASDRRRARVSARNTSDVKSTRPRWLDLDAPSATFTDWQPATRTSNLVRSRTDRSRNFSESLSGNLSGQGVSGTTSRDQGALPRWLSDAYAELEDTVAKSGAATGFNSDPSTRSTTRRPDNAYSFNTADLEPKTTARRRSSAHPTKRSHSFSGSPTTRSDRSRAQGSPRAAVFDEEAINEESEAPKKGLFAKIGGLKKSATKSKADRQFDRQFGDESSMETEPPGPRAAVYKGEMGQQQRYAQRLQQNSSYEYGNFGSTQRRAYRGIEDDAHAPRTKKMSHPILKVGAAAFALVICAGVFMYPTVQSYYQAMREHDRLEAEYQAVEERNDALQSNIDSLSSDEGVAAYAHEQYGWVKPGEQTATVQGLELAPSDGLENVNASIKSGSIEAPETWYSPILDKVFGFE